MSDQTNSLPSLQVHVTGSDPQCGKTVVTAIIARALKEAGFTTVSVKSSEGDVHKFLYDATPNGDEEGEPLPSYGAVNIADAVAKIHDTVDIRILDLCQNTGPDEDFINQHTAVTYKL